MRSDITALASFADAERRALLLAPWRMLETDHAAMVRELSQLDAQLKRHRSHSERRAQTLGRIRKTLGGLAVKLLPHFQAEEKAVFPYLRRYAPRLSPVLRTLIAEHSTIRTGIATCNKILLKTRAAPQSKTQAQALSRKGNELVRVMRAHVQKESRLMRRFSV
jgi:iron-sulfur cluster repair protein YtfE (RIC family)